MLEAVTNEVHSAKRALEEIARRGKKKKEPGTFFFSILLLKQIIKVS